MMHHTSRLQRLMLIALAVLIPATALALLRHRANQSSNNTTMLADATGELQRKIDHGDVKLDFDADHGYLKSLLKNLKIPVSSQTLVFSKSSFQLHLISPEMPRATYFNDDVYVGWVQGGEVIEIASVDPKQLGPVFYTLSQEQTARPKFEKQSSQCLVCHDSSETSDPIPRLLMLSVLPDRLGNAIGAAAMLTTDRSPMRERWGGWYVTGTHGTQRHLGNTIVQKPPTAISNIKDYVAGMDLSAGANITDLRNRFDTSQYLGQHSDIVALMILAHQTHVHNLVTLANYKVQEAIQKHSEDTVRLVEEFGEPVVRTILFSGAEPLTDPVTGTSDFAAEFVRQGPRDSRGRSLRDLDLKHRLLRYPLSYLIYSRSFDEMPDPLKQYVYRRLRAVLSGEDKSEDFAHLSESDRESILGILLETKADFAASVR